MKKNIVILSLFVMMVFGVIGMVIIEENTSKNDNVIIIAKLLRNENMKEVNYEKVKNSEINLGDLAELGHTNNDLVYREYSWGNRLEEGYKIIIDKEMIINKVVDPQKIVIVFDNGIYKEIEFENSDIEFIIKESGNYGFYVVNLNGNSVDIKSIVKVHMSADGGITLLN